MTQPTWRLRRLIAEGVGRGGGGVTQGGQVTPVKRVTPVLSGLTGFQGIELTLRGAGSGTKSALRCIAEGGGDSDDRVEIATTDEDFTVRIAEVGISWHC